MNKIRPIAIDDTQYLGIDDEGRLYWRDQPVKTEQKVTLSTFVSAAVVVAALAAVVQATCSVVELWMQ